MDHLVTPNGVKPNPEKITTTKNYQVPKTTKQIKCFLGSFRKYRRVILILQTLQTINKMFEERRKNRTSS